MLTQYTSKDTELNPEITKELPSVRSKQAFELPILSTQKTGAIVCIDYVLLQIMIPTGP
jgi:hypothetical protein